MGYWLLRPWKHAFDFSGRSPRIEYWMFQVQIYALVLLLALFAGLLAEPGGPPTPLSSMAMILAGVIFVGSLIPGLAVAVRRLHDQNKPGIALLFGLIPFIGGLILLFFVTAGDEEENEYGPNPLGPTGMDTVSEVFD